MLWCAVTVLPLLGGPALALPSPDPRAAVEWARQRDAATIAVAVLRGAAQLTAWYLLLVTIAGVAARLTRNHTLMVIARAVTPPSLRELLRSWLGAGVMTAVLVTGAAGGVRGTTAATAAAAGVALASEQEPAALPPPPPPLEPATPRDAPPPARATARCAPAIWTVGPGQHFWSIADDHLTDRLGRPPSDVEVARYWRRLVAANRDRLVDPANPDLLHVGQQLRLPRVSAARRPGS